MNTDIEKAIDARVDARVDARMEACETALLARLTKQLEEEEFYMDTKRAARFLGLSTQTLEIGRANGKNPNLPPHYKFGNTVRYKRSELEAWAKKRREAKR